MISKITIINMQWSIDDLRNTYFLREAQNIQGQHQQALDEILNLASMICIAAQSSLQMNVQLVHVERGSLSG